MYFTLLHTDLHHILPLGGQLQKVFSRNAESVPVILSKVKDKGSLTQYKLSLIQYKIICTKHWTYTQKVPCQRGLEVTSTSPEHELDFTYRYIFCPLEVVKVYSHLVTSTEFTVLSVLFQ